jgi:hypothetical protein
VDGFIPGLYGVLSVFVYGVKSVPPGGPSDPQGSFARWDGFSLDGMAFT